ncbi:MAG: flagellar hook-associated protein FlgL [Herminiimonas sp.]|nr:flagellar hook-associated protein FlgL [Herminiimonas sp.]
MRISTNSIYDAGVARLGDLQSGLQKTQQQIATGRRILTPADDPVGAARALDLTQGQAVNTQFASNRQNAVNALSVEEGVLQSVTSLMQDAKVLTVQAGNGALDDGQRKYLAEDLRSRFDELMGLANSRDGVGNYMFAGYQVTSQPFSKTTTGASYAGDQGQTMLQVDASRQMALGDSGEALFEGVKATGTFKARVEKGALNVAAPLSVVDSTLLTGHNYDISFKTSPAAFAVYDLTLDPTKTGTPLTTGAYTTPQTIAFDGQKLTVSGAPAAGDLVSVKPSGKQSIFTTLQDLITLLETPATGATGKANLTYGLQIANGNIDNALDNVLVTRTSVGTRLRELDALGEAGDNRNLQYAESLSTIQDLDYNVAISDLTKQQTILEAAQKSFVKVSGLSLFNLL